MRNPRILIIEDDEDIRELCQILLVKAGFNVETCVNGLEALIALQKHDEPCLILLDMMMPVMNGREFMAAFTKKPLDCDALLAIVETHCKRRYLDSTFTNGISPRENLSSQPDALEKNRSTINI